MLGQRTSTKRDAMSGEGRRTQKMLPSSHPEEPIPTPTCTGEASAKGKPRVNPKA